MRVKIDSRGRVTIPEAIRETLGFTDNAYLEVEGNKIIITKEFDPIKVIDRMLDDINICSGKLEYIDVLYKAKKKLEEIC
jgi:AbrB family looped-hinge helix DNA binding protein